MFVRPFENSKTSLLLPYKSTKILLTTYTSGFINRVHFLGADN